MPCPRQTTSTGTTGTDPLPVLVLCAAVSGIVPLNRVEVGQHFFYITRFFRANLVAFLPT